jgi:hypothetical protein
LKRAGLTLAAVLLASCASPRSGPVFPTSDHFPEVVRRPPSFAAEATPPAPPDATGMGVSSPIRRELVPLDSEVAHEVVGRFFIAVLRESTRELLPLLAAQASVLSEGSRQPAQTAWRARFAQLDYTSLSGRLVAAPQTLRTYTFASVARAKQDGVPAPASPSEVVVVARPGGAWVGKARLFGDAVAFRLRPRAETQSFEIAEIVEDFRLP